MYDIWHFHMASYKYLFYSHAIRILISSSWQISFCRTCRLFCSSWTTLIMKNIFGIVRDEWIMNQPDVVLFEIIYCWSQSNTWCVHISSLYTSSQSTGMSTCCNDCNVCGKHFKRLESHLSQNLVCESCYMSRGVNAAASNSGTQKPRMTAAIWTPAMCCKGQFAVAWI